MEVLRKPFPMLARVKNGEEKTVFGITVEAVPAYNLEKPFHPKGNGNGYVLTSAIRGSLSRATPKMFRRSNP